MVALAAYVCMAMRERPRQPKSAPPLVIDESRPDRPRPEAADPDAAKTVRDELKSIADPMDRENVSRAAEKLSRMAPASVEPLVALLSSADETKQHVARAVFEGMVGSPAVRGELIRLISNPKYQFDAASVLAWCRHEKARQCTLDFVADEGRNRETRKALLYRLVDPWYLDPQAQQLLFRLARDKNCAIREIALDVLHLAHDKGPALDILEAALTEDGRIVVRSAVCCLGSFEEPRARKLLTQFLARKEIDSNTVYAVRALESHVDPQLARAFERMLDTSIRVVLDRSTRDQRAKVATGLAEQILRTLQKAGYDEQYRACKEKLSAATSRRREEE